jgi:hypothetical protein
VKSKPHDFEAGFEAYSGGEGYFDSYHGNRLELAGVTSLKRAMHVAGLAATRAVSNAYLSLLNVLKQL